MGIPIKNVLNAVVAKVQSATSTRLNGVPVYKGDAPGWKGDRAIFVLYAGASEEGAQLSNGWWGVHSVLVELRWSQGDSTGATGGGDWYDQFLEACEELNVLLSSVAARTMTDAEGEGFSMLTKTWEIGYGEPIGRTQMLIAQFTLSCTVDMPTA